MPTHDYIIANGTGAAVRADINLALSAIVSLNSSASEPGTMYAYQLWADTAAGLLKIRNGANSAWVTLRQLDGDFSIVAVEDGLQATPSLTFTNDLNTGVFRSGADALAIVTGGQYAITCTSTQAVGIRTPNPSTALHVAGNARVGADDVTDAVLEIGVGASGNRTSYIDIVADTTYTDYGLRIIRNNTGANATSELKHRGTGALNFTTQEAAPIVFNTTNSPALTITSGGLVGIGTTNPGIAGEGAGLVVRNYSGRSEYYSPAGYYAGSIGYTNNTQTRVWLSVDSDYSQGSAVSAGIFLSSYHQDTGGSHCGYTIKDLRADGALVFSQVTTAASLGTAATETERARIDSSGRLLVGTSTIPSAGELLRVKKASTGTNGAGINFEGSYSLDDDASQTVSIASSSLITITNENDLQGALLFATYASATITIISDPSNIIATSDTDTKLCLFKSANTSDMTVKNRLGANKSFLIGRLTT